MQVTVKALRHYEQKGLLVPDEVDEWTGYRYYSIGQMQRLGTIRGLQRQGFTLDEIKEHLAECQKRYFDARHVCYAYMLGHERTNFRANDNGEPSGTAGRPILGAINSRELTDILVVVVRYFGGIKLGTGGLIVAYKAAAAEALDVAEVVEKTVDLTLDVYFEYPMMNEVMRIVKEESPAVVEQDFQMDCRIRLSIRASRMPRLRERYEQLALETGRIRVE